MPTHLQHPPLVRVLRTALQVLIALGAVLPAAVTALATFDIHVDGAALGALCGVAILVTTTVVATIEKAGRTPVIRTLVQVASALAVLAPVAVAQLHDGGIHLDHTKVAAVVGLVVMATTTLQNLLEHHGILPELAAPPARKGRR